MRKTAWIVLMALAVAVATAQSVVGVYGYGAAGPADSNRPDSFFGISITQFTYRDQTRIFGGASLIQYDRNQFQGVKLTRVEELDIDFENGTATFSGQGYYVSWTRDGYTSTAGTVTFTVHDNDPDTIEVAFYPEGSEEATFTYSGSVKRGDIRIYSRSR